MERGGLWGKGSRIVLFGLVIIVLLAMLVTFTILLLDYFQVIDGEAILAFWQERVPWWQEEEEEKEESHPYLEQLRALEKELEELRQENDRLRYEVGQKSKEVQALLQELEELRVKEREWEDERERRLLVGEVYNKMQPREAAAILAELSDEEALAILLLVDAQQVSQILAQMDPARAATLTKAMNNRERR